MTDMPRVKLYVLLSSINESVKGEIQKIKINLIDATLKEVENAIKNATFLPKMS